MGTISADILTTTACGEPSGFGWGTGMTMMGRSKERVGYC